MVRKLGKACALRNWFGGRRGEGRGGGGWWTVTGTGTGPGTGLGWIGIGIGLDWLGLMRGVRRCKMQDAGSAEKDQAGMKGAGARLLMDDMNGLG